MNYPTQSSPFSSFGGAKICQNVANVPRWIGSAHSMYSWKSVNVPIIGQHHHLIFSQASQKSTFQAELSYLLLMFVQLVMVSTTFVYRKYKSLIAVFFFQAVSVLYSKEIRGNILVAAAVEILIQMAQIS